MSPRTPSLYILCLLLRYGYHLISSIIISSLYNTPPPPFGYPLISSVSVTEKLPLLFSLCLWLHYHPLMSNSNNNVPNSAAQHESGPTSNSNPNSRPPTYPLSDPRSLAQYCGYASPPTQSQPTASTSNANSRPRKSHPTYIGHAMGYGKQPPTS